MAHALCAAHYYQKKRGVPLKPIQAHRAKGTGSINSHGYKLVFRPDHPNAGRAGQITEHRLVMSEILGRPLIKGENVHHINGNRLDNRPENLELWNTSQPQGQRVRDKVAWARQILDLYGEQF